MNTLNNLTRNCLICAQKKPLAAFLQITGAKGTTYGNVCSDCRSKYKDQKGTASSDEDASRGSAGVRIDSKTRVYADIKQKEELKQTKETYTENLEERGEVVLDKDDKDVKKQKDELRHRRDYIEVKEKLEFGARFTENKGFNRTQDADIQKKQVNVTFVEESQQFEKRDTERNVDYSQRESNFQTVQTGEQVNQSAGKTSQFVNNVAFESAYGDALQKDDRSFQDTFSSQVDIKQLFLDPHSSQTKLRSRVFQRYREEKGLEPTQIANKIVKKATEFFAQEIKQKINQAHEKTNEKTKEVIMEVKRKNMNPGKK